MTITEKATYQPDLPHDYKRGVRGDCQVCYRPEGDALHVSESVTEQAADRSSEVLVTEKGS